MDRQLEDKLHGFLARNAALAKRTSHIDERPEEEREAVKADWKAMHLEAVPILAECSVIPGLLQVITDEESADADSYPATNHRHYVTHSVTHFTGPDHRGNLRAHTAEGDWCEGRPAALLKRLLEAWSSENEG